MIFECRKNKSIRSSLSASSERPMDRRILASVSSDDCVPRRILLVTWTSSGSRPCSASPTTLSASPRPYIGATSMRLIPSSTAVWTVWTASCRVVSPQMPAIPPPPRVSGLTGHNAPSGLCVADVVTDFSLSDGAFVDARF